MFFKLFFPIALLSIFALCNAQKYNQNDRLDCLLVDEHIYQDECQKRGCIWDQLDHSNGPWCFFNKTKIGYVLESNIHHRENGFDATLKLKPTAVQSTKFEQIKTLNISVTFLTENIVRFKIFDPANKRYEVPVQKHFHIPHAKITPPTQYEVTLTDDFHLVVKRAGKVDTKLIDTSIGGLIFSDNFIQFATRLPTDNLYGFGENYHRSFRHNLDKYTTLPIFTRDQPLGDDSMNSYGAHPYFMVKEDDERAYGVLLLNSNAMAYTLLPEPGLALKTTGGILDFFVFIGDTTTHVTQLYTSVIGRPVMPSFWSLGFQLCRYGYKNTDHVKKVLQRNLDNKVPVDVQYMDIDYLDNHKDFTYDKTNFASLPEFVNATKAKGIKWAIILDPAIDGSVPGYKAFEEGYKRDVFVKWPAGHHSGQQHDLPPTVKTDKNVLYGKVWPDGPAAFPDFFKNSTAQWWSDMAVDFHKTIPFDALWIDMNEPSNFNSKYLECQNQVKFPNQGFKDFLDSKTICMNARQGENGEYEHYDVHNLYGWSESEPTMKAVHKATGKRGFAVSRSTYPSSSQFVAHWLGDNYSSWEQLRQSIVGMLEFSLFGFSFTGSDICGFNGNTNPELCRRWLQLGAFYPFSRSHNGYGSSDQDPGYFAEIGHPEVTNSAVESLRIRYQMLHYLYTGMFISHTRGDPLVQSVMVLNPHNSNVLKYDHLYMLGESVLVAPFLNINQQYNDVDTVKGVWYKINKDATFASKVTLSGTTYRMPDSESDRPVLLRGGSIVPFVSRDKLPEPLNAQSLRKTPIDFWVLPVNSSAKGELFYDDGESIETIEKGHYNHYSFSYADCHLVINPTHSNYTKPQNGDILKVSSIKIPLENAKSHKAENIEVKSTDHPSLIPVQFGDDYLQVNTFDVLDLLQVHKQVKITFNEKGQKHCFLS